MKFFKSFLAFAAVAACAGFVSAQSWQWANAVTGTGNEVIRAVAADNAGNAYVTGYYRISTPAFGSTTLPNADTSDAFIAKYNNAGELQWAKRISNPKLKDAGLAIAVGPDGNPVVGGYLQPANNTSYPLGDSTIPAYSSAFWKIEGDAFIAKYSPSGSPLWVKRVAAGTKSLDAVTGISIDANGNIYTSGYCFGGTTTATPVYYSDILNVSEDIKNGNDGFAAKYDKDGKFIWFKMIIGSTQTNYAYDIAPDNQGNAYVIGIFRDSLKFGSTPYLKSKSTSNNAIFVAKLNAADGAPAWVKAYMDSANDGNFDAAMGCGIASANGSVYIAGQYKKYLGLGSTIIRTPLSTPMGFIAKLKAADGTTIGAYKMNDTSASGNRITDIVLKNNLMLVSGYYAGRIRIGTSIFTSSGATDQNPFVAALDTSFSELWALSGTGSGSDTGFSVAVGKSSIFLGGCYKAATITFTGVTPALSNAATTYNNGFVAAVSWPSAIRFDATQTSSSSSSVRILSGANLTVLVDNQSSGDLRASLIDISGRIAVSQRLSREGRAVFGTNDLARGRYIVRVTAHGTSLFSGECIVSGM